MGDDAQASWRASGIAAALALAVMAGCGSAAAEPAEPRMPWPSSEAPAYPTSPFRGAIDGYGRAIPCRCRFKEQDYRLGDEVCMSTHVGIVIARCDLLLNNTSWVPTGTPCTLSLGPATRHVPMMLAREGPLGAR